MKTLFILWVILAGALVNASFAANTLEHPILSFTFEADTREREAQNILEKKELSLNKNNNNNSLALENGSHLKIKSPKKLITASGTISFWVKPLWDDNIKSHTFMSMRWDGGDNSYMVISYGWWEPEGSNRLYFILSNQDYLHCSFPYNFQTQVWVMITVTWELATNNGCTIYLNEEKLASTVATKKYKKRSNSIIYIGSDVGVNSARGRARDAEYDDIRVFSTALKHKEIIKSYSESNKKEDVVQKIKNTWMDEILSLEYVPRRNSNGQILESRIIFDEDIRWALSKENTDNILSRIKSAGFNVYVPNVWHGRGTYYFTPLTEPDGRLKGSVSSDNDPLAYLIKKARSLGIEVHPWFTVVKRSSNNYPEFYDEGTPRRAYNVHNKKFRKFIVNLMLDVVKRYDVDGINLDYIRTMGICTSEFCKENYKEFTGKNFLSDYYIRNINNNARMRIQKWQDSAVTDIVRKFSIQAKSIKSHLIISVDSHPKPKYKPRPLQGRDSVKWLNDGWIDLVFNMDYRKKVDIENHELVLKEVKSNGKIIFLYGNYEKIDSAVIPRDAVLVKNYAMYSQRRWPGDGVAFYLYNLLSDEQISMLKNEPFIENAIPSWPR